MHMILIWDALRICLFFLCASVCGVTVRLVVERIREIRAKTHADAVSLLFIDLALLFGAIGYFGAVSANINHEPQWYGLPLALPFALFAFFGLLKRKHLMERRRIDISPANEDWTKLSHGEQRLAELKRDKSMGGC